MATSASPTPAAPADSFSRFQLPGLNLPLNWVPSAPSTSTSTGTAVTTPGQGEGKDLFRNALNDYDVQNDHTALPLTTLREFTMLHIMNALSDKPGWDEKVFDDAIAEKWKTEAMTTEGRDVTQEMADWVIDELRYKAKNFKATGMITVYNGDVVKSDTAVPPELKEALQAAVKELEDVPEFSKDYHPGSDEKVLDLVHPSLFPLVYGKTRVLSDSLIGLDNCIESCGKGEVVPVRTEIGPRRSGGSYQYSKNYQWLPSEVEFSKDGTAKFTSYINNLHPTKYKHLYSIIEKIIDNAIPLWNQSLFPLKNGVFHEIRKRIPYDEQEFEPEDEDTAGDSEFRDQEDDEDEDDYEQEREEWWRGTRRLKLPNPGKFVAPPSPDVADLMDLKRDYGHRGLQIIVKLANIELTPEKPTYEGGTWHVEGQLNEHICASALYYLSNSNISPSSLAFRQQTTTHETIEINYEQDDYPFLEEVFGCSQDGPAVQEVGSVACTEGRLLTFPNILQHRVSPFKLDDPTKPGHRKILALFLVDPNIRVISTANVPPQRLDWWTERILKDFVNANTHNSFGKLSQELRDQVFESVEDFPIGMDEAKYIRLELMEERKKYIADTADVFEFNIFSLCEH